MSKILNFLVLCILILIVSSCSNKNEDTHYDLKKDSISFVECTKAIEKEIGYDYSPITIDSKEDITNLLLDLHEMVTDYDEIDGPHPKYNFKFTNDEGDIIIIGINKENNKGIVFLNITKDSGEKISLVSDYREEYYETISQIYDLIEN